MRVFIVVEGQTEELLVKKVLKPHLEVMNVWAIPIIVATSRQKAGAKNKGGGRWAHWHNDLIKLSNEHRGNDVRFTTLFDLYGLPGDFPDYNKFYKDQNTIRRTENLEAAMLKDIGDKRLIPYIQRHEIEALVLVDLEPLAAIADPGSQSKGVVALQQNIDGLAPEDINDGPTTAPSKRLLSFVPGYSKTLHGPLVIEAVGLPKIRAACPRFNAWITTLESLATSSPPNQP